MTGSSARDLNSALPSALRQAERRTRLQCRVDRRRLAERFFNYVPKVSVPQSPVARPDQRAVPSRGCVRGSGQARTLPTETWE